MTVTQESSKSPLYQGDGVVTAFAFNFKVLSDTHLLVYRYNVDTEVTTLLTKDIDYTVALSSGGATGGLVTTTVAPAANMKLRIFRNTPRDQQMNIANQGNFYPSVLNGAADKMVLMIQEIIDTLERAIILDPMSPETPDDLYARINEAMETATLALTVANATYPNLVNYVNAAIAGIITGGGISGAVWNTTVSAGDDTLATPYKFTKGTINVGGAWYNLSVTTDGASLDNSGANTIIEFDEPFVADMGAMLIAFI
jgi:hypothetical protein